MEALQLRKSLTTFDSFHRTSGHRSLGASLSGRSAAFLVSLLALTASGKAQKTSCPDSIVTNGTFATGLVPGSMPSGSVANWSLLTASPQVVTDTCSGAPGAIQMWGNNVVGESIQQTLSMPIVGGQTYRVSLCYRWLDNSNPVLPKFVKFRVCASSTSPSAYPPTASYDVIGVTPTTSSTAWIYYSFPDWKAPQNATHLTINPENGSVVNDGNFVSWGQVDDICVRHVPCPGGIVANGDMSSGLVPGSMPSGSLANWSLLTASPQVVTDTCSGAPGAIQMWGNNVVGESVQQQLLTPIVKGRKYRITVCYRWLDNNNPVLPKQVQFRLCASGAAPSTYPPTSSYDVIGVTPMTTLTTWTSYTFADWTAPNNASYLTLNPENGLSTNHGDYVSWGQVDDICIREVRFCPGTVVANGELSTGLVPGSMPSGSVANWSLLTASPQVVTDTCSGAAGAIQMWGNNVVGESVQQQLLTPIVKGRKYRITVCYRWLDNNNPVLPKQVQFRLCASGAAPSTYPPTSSYDVIGVTPMTTLTTWTSYTFPVWTAPNDANYLTINPENGLNTNHGDYVSWGQVDDICVQDIARAATATPYGCGCRLNQVASAPILGRSMTLTVSGIPSDSPVGFQFLGDVLATGLPLDKIGMHGCWLYATSIFTLPFAVTGSTTEIEVPLPNDANLMGLVVGMQGLALSPSSNAFGLVASNGVELRLGQ
ncbi:MAG: hypothetical protein H6832_01460 [Planctomycetes bacterium]|nr:hypothetical protein [Planctomycetota bacterium]